MPQGRRGHGCDTVTIKKQLHLVVFGGYNSVKLDSIYLFNFATQKWIASQAPMALPAPIDNIAATKITRMDEEGCEMMFFSNYTLYMCSGRYNWKTLVYGSIDVYKNFVVVDANDLLPCGI